MRLYNHLNIYFLLILTILTSNACEDTSHPTQEALSSANNSQLNTNKSLPTNNKINLNECSAEYNGKVIFPEKSIEDLISILGNAYTKDITIYTWKSLGVQAKTEYKKNKVINFILPLHDLKKTSNMADVYLFHKKIDTLNLTIPYLIKKLKLDFEDFFVTNHDYRITHHCSKIDKNMLYMFEADGIWNREGGGHLTYKTTIDKNNTNPIKNITLELIDKE